MMKFVLLTAIAIAGPAGAAIAAAPPNVTADGVTLTSVTVKFPASDKAFPKADGVNLVNANCLACHSPNMVLTQPVLSEKDWQAEVTKMRTLYKAPVSAADVPAIATYLASIQASK